MDSTIAVEGGRFLIRTPWDPAVISDIRKLPGRRAEPDMAAWSVPLQFGAHIRELADRHGLLLVGQARDLAVSPTVTATVDHKGASFELRFSAGDRDLLKAVTAIPGATWFGPSECWLVPERWGTRVDRWSELASAVLTSRAETAVARAYDAEVRFAASSARESGWEPSEGLRLELYDYQRAGIDYIIRHAGGRCIIGDEPGVGKTAQAIGVIHELKAVPAVIVVPASLKVNWRRELNRAVPQLSVEILRGNRAVPRLLWADVIILNYDILPSWEADLPTPLAVVLDESHRIKNPAIARTKSAIALSARVPEGKGARLCLTGTPIPNRTNEIMTQLEAIGRIGDFGGIHAARKNWHNRPIELNRLMRSTCYLRRKKKDVWIGMPERSWSELYVEGDPHVMKEYRAAEKDIVTYLGERARKAALESGATDEAGKRAAWEAAMRASSAEHLVAISHLKQLAARASLPAVKDWAKDFLASGEKLGLFGWHTEIVNGLAEALNGVKVQGGMSDAARNRSVDLFQTHDEVKVFVGQIMAAGEGLTLTAASNVVLCEQAWNQAAHDQVLDRFHRRGQASDVMGYVVLIEDTIGVDIQQLIQAKQKEVTAVVDGMNVAGTGSILPDLVVRLARKGMK
jgi:hypothetical protein